MFTKANAEAYFNAEKAESLVFLIIGLVAILAAGIVFFGLKTAFWKGAAIPLLAIGLIQAVVGYTVYSRSDKQRIDIVYKMDMNPDALLQQELPRMQTVMKNFLVYRYLEIAFLVVGLFLFFYFKHDNEKQFWIGFGLALAIQAFLMLVADGFAEKRGHYYTKGIEAFTMPKK